METLKTNTFILIQIKRHHLNNHEKSSILILDEQIESWNNCFHDSIGTSIDSNQDLGL